MYKICVRKKSLSLYEISERELLQLSRARKEALTEKKDEQSCRKAQ